ncbi:MAG: RHS repeat protein [Anaerolineae bacterium]|nr:RHS repeat protein [Anaerolineae bacterium]
MNKWRWVRSVVSVMTVMSMLLGMVPWVGRQTVRAAEISKQRESNGLYLPVLWQVWPDELVASPAQFPAEAIQSTIATSNTVYLPLVAQNYDPSVIKLNLTSAWDNRLVTPDQVIFRVPAAALQSDAYISYKPVPPASAPQGLLATPRGFEVKAFTHSDEPITTFNAPVVVRVPYAYTDFLGADEATLAAYYWNEINQVWQLLPSTVDYHRHQVVFTTTHFSRFGIMAQTLSGLEECEEAEVGRRSDSEALRRSMCAAFLRAGGKEAMGVAQSGSNGDVHNWYEAKVQDFTGGLLESPILLYRSDTGVTHYMPRPFVIAYDHQANGPNGFLGLPTSDPYPSGPEWYVDDGNDFHDGPTMYFQHGFIGYDIISDAYEAHRNFPKLEKVTWETVWRPNGNVDSNGDPEYEFVTRGTINEADPNPNGKEGDEPDFGLGYWVYIEDEAGTNAGHLGLDLEQTGEKIFTGPYTRTLPYEFYFFIWRTGGDNLSGYYPCNYSVLDNDGNKHHLRGWMGTVAPRTYVIDCASEGFGGPVDLPPQVSIVEAWPDGQGNLSVKAQATDDIGIANVVLESGDGDVSTSEMEIWPSDGSNIYAGVIRNVSANKKAYFTVTATDTGGQTATVDQDNRVPYSSAYGLCSMDKCYEGNPVNTATGNDTDIYVDLTVPGRGETDIVIDRTVNSQEEQDGPFGRGTSFSYDMALSFVDNPLLQGIQVRYGDGHTANFQEDGSGRYTPVSPGNFDYITSEDGNYVLHLKNRTTYQFDGNGRLREIRNRNDVPITLGYNAAGKLSMITNASGRSVTLQWTGEYITEIQAPEGKTLRYAYEGNLLQFFTDANEHTTEYQYDAEGRVIAVITPNGYPHARQEFDDRGRVVWQIIGEGERRDFTYDDDARVTTVTDVYENVITYAYTEQYMIASITDARGNTAYYDYDERGNRRSYTNRRGFTWHYDYDEDGNRIYQSEPVASNDHIDYTTDVTRWAFNEFNDIISSTNALGDTWLYDYDENGNLRHAYLPDGSKMTMTYNSYGQVLSLTDGEGQTTTNTYDDTMGDLVSVTDGESNTTYFGYDDLGRQTVITDANGHVVRMVYDGNDNVMEVVDAKSEATRFVYDPNNDLTDIYDRRDGHLQNEYDQSDRLHVLIDPEGSRTEYGYNLMGHVTVITNARGFTTHYQYDQNYNVIAMQDEDTNWWYYEYDANNNLTVSIDPHRTQTRYVYDAVDRVKYEIDALYNVTEYCYDAEDQIVTLFDPRRAETQFEYDPLGRLTHLLNPLGETYDWIYDDADNLVAEINGENETTRYVYDKANRRVATINPLGDAITVTYDGIGNAVGVIDALGNLTEYGYDQNNNLVIVTNTLGYTVTLGYDEEDQQIWVRDPKGSLTQFDYYLDGQVRQITEPGGATTSYRYDPRKNLSQITNARGLVTAYTYDSHDLLLSVTDPLSHTSRYAYDELMRLVAETDAEGQTSYYDYDALGRLIRVTDAISGVTAYTYDAVGNMTFITYTNGTTATFYYNYLNQLVREVDGLDHSWTYAYDKAGRLVRRVDGEWQATYYDYNDAGKLITVTFGSTGKHIVFEYDANGNEIAMHDWNGTLTRQFDVLNRPITVTDYLSRSLMYAWNPDGTRAGLTYPDGRVVTTTYDVDSRPETLILPGGQTADYAYTPEGYLEKIAYSNGAQINLDYDDADRLISLHNSGADSTPIAWYDYVLNKVGNRTATTELRVFTPETPISTVTRNYTYDDLHRLIRSTSSVSQSHEMNWELDGLGNWVGQHGVPEPVGDITVTSPVTMSYEHNAINALVQAGDWFYQQDRDGNRIMAQASLTATAYAALTSTFGPSATLVINYEYDYENRLTAVHEVIQYPRPSVSETIVLGPIMQISPTMEARYVYDGLGRRVEKWVTRTVTASNVLTEPTILHRSYVYDGLDVIVEYEEQSGEPDSTTHYYWGNDRLVALEHKPVTGTTELLWYHYDGLGSVIALTDEAGNVSTTYRYDEYGQLLDGKTRLNRYTYTGQEWDTETDFYHFYARYYAPEQGVWLTQDIHRGNVSDPLSLARYTFVTNNPINFYDLLGYWGFKDAWNTVKDAASDVGDWVEENQDVIAKTTLTVAAGVGTAALCAATAGVGCALGAAAIAATASYGKQVVDNAWQNGEGGWNFSQDTFTKNIDWRQIAIDGVIGGLSAGIGQKANYISDELFGVCKNLGCMTLVGGVTGAAEGALTQLASNATSIIFGDPCVQLFDNVGNSALSGGVFGSAGGFAKGLKLRKGVDVELHSKYAKDPDAIKKIDYLNKQADQGNSFFTKNIKRNSKIIDDFKTKNPNVDWSKYDVDHMLDLQASGKDISSNLWKLDKGVNRSIGSSMHQQFKKLEPGQKIASFVLKSR